MQIWAEPEKAALPICNYSQILYQFLTFTQNLKRSLFFAVYFIGHFYFEIWNASVILAELLIATAIVVFVWVRSFSDKS